ncbi:MAG: dockerin type I repeat-containing protein, partial [Bacteroidales bacterium]|nr:dockerin type I repeat-containing protein [Bacteroidales bacterium]
YIINFIPNYFVITATAEPNQGGTIYGAGIYYPGDIATLTATANAGYTFVNWTKDGTVVSANPTYSFTVTEDVYLVANFKLPGDANGDGTVSALDVVIIVNYIFGTTPEEFVFENADINEDGVVNALDLVAIINLIFSKKM